MKLSNNSYKNIIYLQTFILFNIAFIILQHGIVEYIVLPNSMHFEPSEALQGLG